MKPNPMNKNLPPQQDPELLRFLSNQLRPEERKNLRKTEEWETCFRSWLEFEQPSEIARTLMLRPATNPTKEEEFLVWMDGKALQLIASSLSGMDAAESLATIFPYPENWEDSQDEPFLQPIQDLAEEFFNRVTESESSDPL